MNTNQKIAVGAIIAAVLVALFMWYQSPFNQCVRANASRGIGFATASCAKLTAG